MAKEQSGQADVGTPVAPTPQEEGIELQMVTIAIEKLAVAIEKLATATENRQPDGLRQVSGIGAVPQLSPEEAARQAEIDKINAERLGRFQSDKKAMEKKALEEERRRRGD